MSFTSNSWKKNGGLNRTKMNQNINSYNMTPSKLNVLNEFGTSMSNIATSSNLSFNTTSYLYNIKRKKNFNNCICYYPFNNTLSSFGISNESLFEFLASYSNQIVYYLVPIIILGSVVGTSYPELSNDFPLGDGLQMSTKFPDNCTSLISVQNYNTSEAFLNTYNGSISTVISVTSFIYVPSGSTKFCLFAMDDENQTSLNSNGNVNVNPTIIENSIYVWYPEYSGKLTIYFTTKSVSLSTYSFAKQYDKVNFDTWHLIKFSCTGNSIQFAINGETIVNEYISIGSFIPNKPISINLGYKYYDVSNNTIINNNNNNNGSIYLLDYEIFNAAMNSETGKSIYNFEESINSQQNYLIPNRSESINYVIGNDIIFFSEKILSDNGLTNNGNFINYGQFDNFSTAKFYDNVEFYGAVTFDSSVSLL